MVTSARVYPRKVEYTNLKDINEVQTKVMLFVDRWVHEEKTPVPRKEIIANMLSNGVNDRTTEHALSALMRKGYLRRAVIISNKTSYVMLRRP